MINFSLKREINFPTKQDPKLSHPCKNFQNRSGAICFDIQMQSFRTSISLAISATPSLLCRLKLWII